MALCVLPLLVYGRFIFLGDELANADVFLAYRPAHAWLADGLRRGTVPLWNPYLLGGFPLAFTEYGWFSPLNWLPLVAAGGHAGYYAAVALYVALASTMAYGLARCWGASRVASVVAGLAYGHSLHVIGGAPLLNQGAAYWALPALLWGIDAHFRGARLAAPCTGAVTGLLLLGSHPQMALLVGTPAAAYAAYLALRLARLPAIVPLVAAAVTAAAVAAVRYLPTLALVAASTRAGGLSAEAGAVGSVSPHGLLAGMLLPSLALPRVLSPQWTAYLGPLPLLLAAAALRAGRRDGRTIFLASIGGAGALLSLGSNTPLYWLVWHTPLLAYFRDPSRFLLWTVLAVAMLGAFGLDRGAAVRDPVSPGATGATDGQGPHAGPHGARRLLRRLRPTPSGTTQGRFPSGPEQGNASGEQAAPGQPRRAPHAWRWVAVGTVVLLTASFAGANALLRYVQPRVLVPGATRALGAATGREYPPEHYLNTFLAAWFQVLRATNPLEPGVFIPLAALGGAAWWWGWQWPFLSAPAARPAAGLFAEADRARWGAVTLVALPLLAYGQVRLPAIPAPVVRESVAVQTEAPDPDLGAVVRGGIEPRLAPALAPRVLSWQAHTADYELRLAIEATGRDATVPSYRFLKRHLAPNFGLHVAIPHADGYENLMSREQALLAAALGSERAPRTGELALMQRGLRERRLAIGERWGLAQATGAGLLVTTEQFQPLTWPSGVRYEPRAVPAAGELPALTVYRVAHPAPRAFVTPEWTVVASAEEAVRELMRGTDAGGRVRAVVTDPAGGLASQARASPAGALPASQAPIYEARIVSYEERRVEVESIADTDALLILLDAGAPGWRAEVTGTPAPIYTANVAFRAVPVPAGRHLVIFTYTPPSWPVALAATGAGALVLAGWFAMVMALQGRAGRSTVEPQCMTAER